MKIKEVLKTTALFILSLIFIVLMILLGWSLLTSMIKVFGDQTKSVEPTIVVAIISGLAAIIVNAISKGSERKNQVFLKTKEKMVEVYESFLNDFNYATNDEKSAIIEKYDSLFAVNASDDTYNEYMSLKNSEEKDVTRLIVSIRKELKISSKSNQKQDDKA